MLQPQTVALTIALSLLAQATTTAQTPTGDQLPNTQPLTLTEPLDVVMVRGINRFAERELAASRERRAAKWHRDYSSVEAYLKSVEPHRQRLREMIGAVDPLTKPDFSITEWDSEHSYVRWSVAEGVTAEGCVVSPMAFDENGIQRDVETHASVILIPDANQAPESLAAFRTATQPAGLARRLAECGCNVLVVAPIGRGVFLSGHADIRWTNLPHRELVYRCGFELGRHPIGYEVESVLQASQLFESFGGGGLPIAVVGVGDGGLVALCAAALSPEFDACYIAGYFDERESVWKQPIDRNIFGLLTEFGDADIASLVAPRPLIIDSSPSPAWAGPTSGLADRLPYAAPGAIGELDQATVQAEFARAEQHYDQLGQKNKTQLVPDDHEGAAYFSEAAVRFLLFRLGIRDVNPPGAPAGAKDFSIANVAESYAACEKRVVESLIRHSQTLLHRSDKVREKFWKEADRSSVDTWVETSQKYRDYIHDHMIGRLPLPTAPLNPRSRKVIDEPTHTGWEVVLDVYPGESSVQSPMSSATTEEETLNTGHSTLDSSVIAGGILLLPTDLQPGEQRPVVVCQHGLEGVPMDTITTDESQRAWGAYKGFSTQLVKRGFIVYAPQNPYRGEDEFRVIQRKSNPLGRSLFSYIIEQHRQTLTWLATLPYVDPERIAFYGLSYGGKTAMRVPPLLKRPVPSVQSPAPSLPQHAPVTQPSTLNPQFLNHPEYCLSICSADFNEWIRKCASAEDRYSYVFTKEYEMYEWNMGHIAGYAELASLMTPRPFMVERGHDDGVAPDEWVGWEFAKVRRHYDKLGIGDRAEIEWFNGPHTINGQGTFKFLHKHLNWPEPAESNRPK